MGIAFGSENDAKDTEFRLPQTQSEWLDMFTLIKQYLARGTEAIKDWEVKRGREMTVDEKYMFRFGWDACNNAVDRAMSFFMKP